MHTPPANVCVAAADANSFSQKTQHKRATYDGKDNIQNNSLLIQPPHNRQKVAEPIAAAANHSN
jgi:hypothetical protein